jgi:hypothetical protein
MNLTSKSILAKLLAKENITVQHGNFPTAFFNVQDRVLGLPLFKEMNKDVYDLMIGHEVGHAIETPADGWHNSEADIPGCPRAFINVIEDIRIEKLIQRRYPGLLGSFKRGYNQLKEMDFFELGSQDINALSFMNRVNLKSKLRDLIDITFSEEEKPYFDMAMSVETWNDVIKTCQSIYEYLKEKQKNEDAKQESIQQTQQKTDGQGNSESGDRQDQSTERTKEHSQVDDTDHVEPNADKDSPLDSSESNVRKIQVSNVEDREVNQKDTKVEAFDHMDVSTDEAYHRNEESLIAKDEYNKIPLVIKGLNRDQLADILVPYHTLATARKKSYDEYYNEYYNEHVDEQIADINIKYKAFVEETSKIVGVMIKEFEMRKAAFQYARAKTSRSGTLNVNKLHEYRFNDDIFRKITKLADAKSHGMIMLIDKSGSMSDIIGSVIQQTLTLAMFCKKAGIPFDVYTFTTMGYKRTEDQLKYTNHKEGEIVHSKIALCQVISSSLNRADYEEAYHNLYSQSMITRVSSRLLPYLYMSEYESMGGTPSNEVMTAMPMIIQDFKNKHSVQKIIVPILTDGSPSQMTCLKRYDGYDTARYGYVYGSVAINVSNKYIRADQENKIFPLLVDHLRSLGVTTVGYFLANNSHDFKAKVGQASQSWSSDTFRKAAKDHRTQKFVSFDNTLGYDRYFIVKANNSTLSTEIDQFEVRDGAKNNEIARAFKKYASSKKTNRIFAAQFAEIIS